jgi:uncharacterized protein YggE
MKKLIFLSGFSLLFAAAYSQQTATNLFPKTISVNGSAEMEIVPDQIFVNVVLREYQKKGESKKELEMLKNDFLAACQSAGIADSVISIVSYTGYNNYFWLRKKKKTPDLFAGITYQVKFSASNQMDDLVDKLDDEATQSFDIVNTSHSKMSEFRKLLKIQAVKAAKDKALYLTDAIGEKLGSAITIKEPEEPTYSTVRPYASQAIVSNVYSKPSFNNDKSIEVDFKSFKLRYVVDVVFALQ